VKSLRAEATAILQNGGLLSLLTAYGRVVPHGSYSLDLMVWRDLDLYVSPPSLRVGAWFELGGRIADALGAHRMHFRDERANPSDGLPRGLYWGIYLRDEPYGPWKIDLWAVETGELERLTAYEEEIARRLTPETRRVVLDIKSRVHTHPQYRRGFSATHIYDAVLDAGVRDLAQFAIYVHRETAVQLGPETIKDTSF
jgi:hypothetical protein